MLSFMFLGGLPDPESDAGKCWLQFLKVSNQSYFSKVIFTVHPIRPTDKPTGFWKSYLSSTPEKGKIQLVNLTDKKTHLKTKWATRSLVDVTISMIKESYNKQNTIKKFILLEGKTCPLYNLQVLYDTLMKNRKSWMDPLNNSCKDILKEHPNLYCKKNICLKKKDCSYWSQWLILDAKHIKPLLLTKINKDDDTIDCNGTLINQVEVGNKKKNLNARIIEQSLFEMLDNNQKPCAFADELYFGLLLKRNRTRQEFVDIIQLRKSFKKTYNKIKDVHSIDIKDSRAFNTHEYSETDNSFIDPDTMSKDTRLINYNRKHIISANKSNVTYPFYMTSIKFNDREVKGVNTVSSIYTDWRYVNLNPFNIFRSYEHPELVLKTLVNSKSLSTTIKKLLDFSDETVSFESLKMNEIPYWSHPLEYNSLPLYKFINAYNMLEFFSQNSKNDYHLHALKAVYTDNILSNVKKIKYSETDGYKFITGVQNPNQLFGTHVNAETLNEARMRGSLFIRKCEDGSFIQYYADQMYTKHPKYVY
jgi:hypothetical protein